MYNMVPSVQSCAVYLKDAKPVDEPLSPSPIHLAQLNQCLNAASPEKLDLG